jgi:hypothetical protein
MRDEATRELWNWRRAHSDSWLDDHLGVTVPPAFKEMTTGKAFDEPEEYVPPIDESLADFTEAIIVKIGTIDPDIYEAMVGFWPYSRSEHRIAQDMGKSVRYVKSCLNSGERLYKKMRKT